MVLYSPLFCFCLPLFSLSCVFVCVTEPWGFRYWHLWIPFGVGEGRRTHGAHLLWISHTVWTVRPDACHRLLLQATGNPHSSILWNVFMGMKYKWQSCTGTSAYRKEDGAKTLHEHGHTEKWKKGQNCKQDKGHKHISIHNTYIEMSAKGSKKIKKKQTDSIERLMKIDCICALTVNCSAKTHTLLCFVTDKRTFSLAFFLKLLIQFSMASVRAHL